MPADPNLKTNPENPVDDVVNSIIQSIARKGRGFSLSNDGGKITVVESLPPVDEFIPVAERRAHRIADTDSFIGYARRYGSPDKSIVLFNQDAVTLTIDEQQERGDREVITLDFETSDDFDAWQGAVFTEKTHRDFLQFLLKQEHNLIDPAVLTSMQSLRLNATVNHESDVRREGNTLGVVYKTTAGEEIKKFPREFRITLPVLEQDIQPSTWHALAIRLDITLPSKPGEGASFRMSSSEWPMLRRTRALEEGKKISDALKDFTVLHGVRSTTARTIGNPKR